MELFKSLNERTKLYSDPFKHFEINKPLTQEAIDEICAAEIADPKKQNLNYDGTRALDGGTGIFRAGIKDGGKAKKLRCYVTKENSNQFPNLTKFIEELRSPEVYKKIGSLIGKDLNNSYVYTNLKQLVLEDDVAKDFLIKPCLFLTFISSGEIEIIFALSKFLIVFLVENLFIKKP